MSRADYPMVKAYTTERRSPYNRLVVILLWWFLGLFGVHRFYVGKFGTGLVMLLTGGGFGIWWIYDLILILTGRFRDGEGRVLGPPQVKHRQLPAPQPQRPAPKKLEDQIGMSDEELMRDPLEEEFARLEQDMKDRH